MPGRSSDDLGEIVGQRQLLVPRAPLFTHERDPWAQDQAVKQEHRVASPAVLTRSGADQCPRNRVNSIVPDVPVAIDEAKERLMLSRRAKRASLVTSPDPIRRRG
jgi:hypothetical protein